ILAGLILLMISPIMLAIAVAVKLSSPGPIFYRQERMSWNNKTFWMLKFRSMPVDAEGASWRSVGEGRRESRHPRGHPCRPHPAHDLTDHARDCGGGEAELPRPDLLSA
ncbi:hypothetical protein C7E14_22835, partial [Stenotrophomonas maltophilia]